MSLRTGPFLSEKAVFQQVPPTGATLARTALVKVPGISDDTHLALDFRISG